MGRAHVFADASLLARLRADPRLSDLVHILRTTIFEPPSLYLIEVSSPLLPAGYNHFRELIAEGNDIRFKRYAEV